MDKSRLLDVISPELDAMGIEIVDLELTGNRGKALIKLFVDKKGETGDRCTISVGDCERVSRAVERLLDVEDLFADSYVLEVSTPGIERPLRNLNDYSRFRGKLARVTLNEAREGETFFEGRIMEVGSRDNGSIFFEVNGKQRDIAFTNIKRAKLTFER